MDYFIENKIADAAFEIAQWYYHPNENDTTSTQYKDFEDMWQNIQSIIEKHTNIKTLGFRPACDCPPNDTGRKI
jgi:hypothetical protein